MGKGNLTTRSLKCMLRSLNLMRNQRFWTHMVRSEFSKDHSSDSEEDGRKIGLKIGRLIRKILLS